MASHAQPVPTFNPITERVGKIARLCPKVVTDLETVLDVKTNIYVDYGNVRPWCEKLGWHVDIKRLYQLFKSYPNTGKLILYYGTMPGDADSERFIKDAKNHGFEVKTKPVKKIRISIDASSVSSGAPDILRNFIARQLLESLSVKQIEELNAHLKELNARGINHFEDLKCNFDVEMGIDVIEDLRSGTEGFALWSCDCDFADVVLRVLNDGKKVTAFGVAGRFAKELNQLQPAGLRFFEVKRLKEFLCWPRELDPKFK